MWGKAASHREGDLRRRSEICWGLGKSRQEWIDHLRGDNSAAAKGG